MEAGYNDHLAKPIQPDDLFAALERVCAEPAVPLLHDTEPDAKVH